MAKIDRVDANLKAFASEARTGERIVFGSNNTTPIESDDLTTNYTAEFRRGWASGVNPATGFPLRGNFSGATFFVSQVLAYIHQMGVPEWNSAQEYPTNGSVTIHSGSLWILNSASLPSIGEEPGVSANWKKINPDVIVTGRGYNVGDIFMHGGDTAPPGSFHLDGSTVVNMASLYPDLWSSSASGRFFTTSGNDGILVDALDFMRGKGSSSRNVGEFENDAMRDHEHRYLNGNGSGPGLTWINPVSGIASEEPQRGVGSVINSQVSNENRPKSRTVLMCLYHGVFA